MDEREEEEVDDFFGTSALPFAEPEERPENFAGRFTGKLPEDLPEFDFDR